MLTTLLLVSTLAGPPADWSDPFVPVPVERFAAYWSAHVVPKPATPAPKPAPLPPRKLTLSDFADAPKPHPLTRAEARELAAAMTDELVAEAEVHAVLISKRSRAVVASGMLCEAHKRKAAAAQRNSLGILDQSLALAYVHAVSTIETAELDLSVLGVQPLACWLGPVADVAECLGDTPPAKCVNNTELAAQIRAAGKIAGTP